MRWGVLVGHDGVAMEREEDRHATTNPYIRVYTLGGTRNGEHGGFLFERATRQEKKQLKSLDVLINSWIFSWVFILRFLAPFPPPSLLGGKIFFSDTIFVTFECCGGFLDCDGESCRWKL